MGEGRRGVEAVPQLRCVDAQQSNAARVSDVERVSVDDVTHGVMVGTASPGRHEHREGHEGRNAHAGTGHEFG